MRTEQHRALPSWLVGSGVIAVAMGVMNLGTYGFTIIAARLLGPSEYGALAALMGVLLVVNVASLGLQATGARRVSAAPEELAQIEADVLVATYRSAIVVGVVCLAAAPLVANLLRLDEWLSAAMLAATAVPLTVMGGQAGILQGERRWLPLAGVYLAVGLGRVACGTAMMVLHRSTLSAMIGVAAGAVLPVVVGTLALREPARRSGLTGRSRRVIRELFHNSHALLAFFALSNVDVVMARVLLDEHQAGLYAGGLILAKAVLFLPQFVVVIAFPSMSEVGAKVSMLLEALASVLLIGLLATAAAWLLPRIAVEFIGGSAYGDLSDRLWAFAALGTIWAMTQLLVYNVVARQNKRAVALVWLALVVLVSLSGTVSSIQTLLTLVLTVESTLLVVLLVLGLRRTARVEVLADRD